MSVFPLPAVPQKCPLRPGDRVFVEHRDAGLYPKKFSGTVEKIYPAFILVRHPCGYAVTVHVTDLGKVRKAGAAW
ncbi:MAG: hypothetical protein HPY89_00610 [Pelotomaculum sp.]|nr:hypothetical protein [Pelotomaculum sp.]